MSTLRDKAQICLTQAVELDGLASDASKPSLSIAAAESRDKLLAIGAVLESMIADQEKGKSEKSK